MDLASLNSRFGLEPQLRFVEGKGGFVYAEINNAHAQARVSTYAGQVLSYRPHKQSEDLLFVSDNAYFEPGKAIKGGVPICWPWFGSHASDPALPAHGFVRNRQWQVTDSGPTEDGGTRLVLTAPDNAETRALWPDRAELQLVIEVGAELTLSMRTRNLGEQPLTLTQALHTYFRVGDIASVALFGLEGRHYLDATDGYAEKQQEGALQVHGEVNRIYTDTSAKLLIQDASLGRNIHISSSGSHSAVVWNPWIDTAKAMGDLQDDDYQRMLCVETSNAGPDQIRIDAGKQYCLQASYRIESSE